MLFLLQCTYAVTHTCGGHYQTYLVLLAISALLFFTYIFLASKNATSKKGWNVWRTASFTFGSACLAVSFSPPLVDFAHHNFTGHTIQHLLLGMLAPIGLVLGAPVSLALYTASHKRARAISRVLSSSYFHFISTPIVVVLLNSGSLFLLYLTPLLDLTHQYPALHILLHVHMLMAGYLFTWTIIGPDPAPRRPKMEMRVLVLFISIAAHSFLSKYMYAYHYPKTGVYRIEEIKSGAKLMYYGGDLIELIVIVALFTLWYRGKGKPYYQFNLSLRQVFKQSK